MATSSHGNLNEIWRFIVSTQRWTWMAGDDEANRFAYQTDAGIEDSKNTPSARESGTFWSSGDGRELYLFGGYSPSTG